MRKKSLWSTMLTFATAVVTVVALSGMTVLADGNNVSFSIDEFTIEHSGYSYVNYYLDTLEFGEFYDEYGTGHVYYPEQIRFDFYGGTLSCGDNSIDFEVAESVNYHTTYLDSYDWCDTAGQTSTLYLYVDPADYRAADPGVYTGKLKIVPVWWEDWDYYYEGDPIFIDISLVVNEKAGDNLEWSYDDDLNILRIEGTGPMNDFDSAELTPWYGIMDEIDSVIISEGVTYVGSNAFVDCSALKYVYLSKTVASVASDAFTGCTGVNNVVICNKPTAINWNLSGFGSSTTFKVPRRFVSDYQALYSGKTFTEYVLSDGGSCGTNDVSWIVDGDGVMVFSGTGTMTDYSYSDETPWKRLSDDVSEIIIGDGIENIPSYAFYYFEELTSVSIPDSVTQIGSYAFSNCKKLDSITLPAGLTRIDYSAFNFCMGFKTIVIPEGTTTIGDSAFIDCTNLETVVIPESVTSIGYSAFSGCTKLTSVNIPENIKVIQGYTFANCHSLKTINIPSSVKQIKSYAFYQCYKLEEVELPEGLTELGSGAFDDCISLKSISIPSGIKELNYEVFQNCDSFTEVTIPSTVETIGTNAFYSCDNLKTVTIENGVQTIGQSAFNSCEELKTITIPNSIKTIEGSAFAVCTSLESVVIPEGVETIGGDAFTKCAALKSITIPSTAELSTYVFSYCSNLETVVIKSGCPSIPEATFRECSKLESVTIPDTVGYIGSDAFRKCTSLKSITIPGSVLEIGSWAFMDCTSLEHVNLGDGIRTIGYQSFDGCSALTTFIIPSTVSAIKSYAFENCTGMTDVYSFADPMVLTWYACSTSFKYDQSTKCHVLDYYLHEYESMHGEANVTYVGDLNNINMGAGTHLYGLSLSLDGSIGVNFYMTLEDSVTGAGSNAYMLFTVNGYTQKVFVKDITPDSDGYYIFKCKVAAKEMADNINARLYVDDAIPTDAEYNFCVRQYANYILKRPALYSEETVALVKAMLNYGAYSQFYFNHNTSNLANSVLPASEQTVEIIDESALRPYTGSASVDGRLTFYSASLSTKSETVLNFYFSNYEGCDHLNFKLDDGTAEGKVLSQSFSGGLLKVTVPNIPAQCAGDDYKIDVYEGSVLIGSITFSPVNYCYNVIHREITPTRTEALKLEVSAYILFYQKAVDYINSL